MNKANLLFWGYGYKIFVYLILDQFFTVDAFPKTITVTPQSKAGSKVGTINFIIKESQVNNTFFYIFFFRSPYFTIHNNSGEQILHSHDIHPTFSFLVRNTNDTITSSYDFLSALQNSASAQCVYNSTTYLTIPLDVILSSDSLYHLGDQVVYLEGLGHSQNFGLFHIITMINLRVQAGMDMFMGSYKLAC